MAMPAMELTKSDVSNDLRCLPCLSLLNDEEFSDISESAEVRRLCKNEIIFLESEPLKSTIVVKVGSVKLCKTALNGREFIINVIWPGEYYCYPPLKADTTNVMSAMAFTDSTVLLIPSNRFKALLDRKIGKVGLRIVSGLCETIAHLSEKIDDLAFRSVEQRISKTLYALADDLPVEDGLVTVHINHHELAAMVGTAREVVSRIVGKLKDKHVISDSRSKNFKVNKNMLLKHIKGTSSAKSYACCGAGTKI